TNFITLGLAARTVADLAVGLQVIAGPAPEDPWSRGVQPPDYLAPLRQGDNPLSGLRGRRVLVIEKMGNARISAGMGAALERTAGLLQEAGAVVRWHPEPVNNGRQLLVTMMRAYQNIRLRPMLATHRDRMDPSLV